MKNFNTEKFVENLSLNFINYKVDNAKSINKQFENFLSLFTLVVNGQAPLPIRSRKEQKLQKKPWLSSALLKSIRIKNKIYANLQKRYDKQQFISYKSYRNALNRAIEQAKQNYYNNAILYQIKMIQEKFEKQFMN